MDEEGIVISPLAAIIAVLATFMVFLFLGTIFLILLGDVFVMVFGELLLIVVPLGYMLYKGIDIKKYIGLEVKPRTVLLGIVLGILLFFFDLVISTVLVSIFGTSEAIEEANNLILNMSSSPQGLFSLIVALSLAGICEEFTFRGFLQTAINSRYSFGVSLLISSLAFGLIHFDPQIVYTTSAFLLGLLLGYIYHHWRLYLVPAVAHATLNLVVLTVSVLLM